MLKNKEIIFGKYLSGNLSTQETEKLMAWLKESAANQAEFDQAEKVWNLSINLKKEKDADVELAWQQFKSLTASSPLVQTKKTNWLRIAAAVALFVVMGIVVKLFFLDVKDTAAPMAQITVPIATPAPEETVVVPSRDTVIDTVVIEVPSDNGGRVKKKSVRKLAKNSYDMITISTGDSAKAFMLPDNSIVFLNAHSKLEYPANFNKTQRRVALTGEAYFEVAKDSNQFILSCHKTIIRGSLTTFNVKSNANDEVEVIVVSGLTEFSGVGHKDFKKLVINPGERATYNKTTGAIAKAKNTRKDFKWWKKSLRAKIRMFFEKLRNKL